MLHFVEGVTLGLVGGFFAAHYVLARVVADCTKVVISVHSTVDRFRDELAAAIATRKA